MSNLKVLWQMKAIQASHVTGRVTEEWILNSSVACLHLHHLELMWWLTQLFTVYLYNTELLLEPIHLLMN